MATPPSVPGQWSQWVDYGVQQQVTVPAATDLAQFQHIEINHPGDTQPGVDRNAFDLAMPYPIDAGSVIATQQQQINNFTYGSNPDGFKQLTTPSWQVDAFPIDHWFAVGSEQFTPYAAVTYYAHIYKSGPSANTTQARIDEAEFMATGWRGSDVIQLPPLPPPMQDLTFAREYYYIPGTTDFVQYEQADPLLQWPDVALEVNWAPQLEHFVVSGGGGTTRPPLSPLTYTVQVFYGPVPNGGIRKWWGYAPGTLLQEISVNLADHGWDNATNPGPNFTTTETLQLSKIALQDFVLWFQTDYYGPRALELPDIAYPPAGGLTRRSIGFEASLFSIRTLNIQANYRLPRFRYWVPQLNNLKLGPRAWQPADFSTQPLRRALS